MHRSACELTIAPERIVSLWARALLGLAVWSAAGSSFGWIYPEHRDIAVLAVQGLDAERKAVFDRFWQDARAGDEQRLCAQGADTKQGLAPPCIDWAALSGIAGDHSCSSQDMLETVRTSDWILLVADVAAQLKVDLARIPVTVPPGMTEGSSNLVADARRQFASEKDRAERLNALRTADVRLQRADPQYASRADANFAHFMLPRPDTNLDPFAYAEFALKPGSPLNAPGVYIWFHLSALQKASRLANEQLAPEERRALTRAALFDEAFSLHFLEDMYAAGHVAGSWGDVSQRKGTHDFYNQNGLEVFTWTGRDRTIVLMGDAHMRPQDAEFAAKAVRISIEQVLDAAVGSSRSYSIPYLPSAPDQPDAFDICKSVTFSGRGLGVGSGQGTYKHFTDEVLLDTPVPALGPGLGSLPRTRSEIGQFVGLAGSIDARAISGGFVPTQSDNGGIAGVDLGFRAGFGFEGALGDSGDGLVFGQIGFRAESPSSNKAVGTAVGGLSGSLSAAIPARSGPSLRVRMPFYLVPGDLLLLSPMYFFDRQRYAQLAVTAANGGLLGWQQGWATRYGHFQFVLGRELGVTWFGWTGNTQLVAPSDPPGGLGRVVNYKSVFFDLPIFEYRPYRAFSSNQSSTVLFQLFAGADIPYGESIDSPPGAPPVNLRTVYSLGLRMVFDWRYYR
ncbi:MAG: hypothetical protein LJE97_06820 [Betaproteobacteria bacterium]|nr:hypothetical protein [Betaproteobacteria bacterium]